MAQWNNSRKVRERIVVEGTLHLETPTHFGNGDVAGLTDISILRDPLDGRALLTGASIAGALRNYLRERELGYGHAEGKDGDTRAEKLFGFIDEREAELEASVQSWLIVEDALGETPTIELRDGVGIDARTRTAERNKLYDMELLQAGTEFLLRFELWLGDDSTEDLVMALATALKGLETGEIGLGKRKGRGFGECGVTKWRARRYKMNKLDDVIAWLKNDFSGATEKAHIEAALGDITLDDADKRKRMTLDATFVLDGSLLIRSSSGKADDPDAVHLKSKRNGRDAPIVSGTSVAGAIRARAQRIANTLDLNSTELIEGMFGKGESQGESKTGNREHDKPHGSRVIVREREIKNAPETELVQSRVKIDRFTGGAFPQALFQEEPLFGDGETRVCIELELRAAKDAKNFSREVGLLLLVLKDLWTGDLPLGGEASVGRGRLKGETATLRCDSKEWVLTQKDNALEIKSPSNPPATADDLEKYVRALQEVAA